LRAGRSPLVLAAPIAFAIGVGLMVPFESTITRIGGIIALAVFVACGLTAIAEPGFLTADEVEEEG
jgi:hypothetical protein